MFAEEFGLSPVARQILIAVAAPGLWGELARLYGILGNDEKRPLVDELLLAQLLAPVATREAIAAELDRDAPLVRHGLVRIGEGRMRPFWRWRASRWCCASCAARAARPISTTSPSSRRSGAGTSCWCRARSRTRSRGRWRPRRPAPRCAWCCGRDGSGRHTLLATIAAAAGRSIGVVDAGPILRDLRVRLDQLRTALRRAHLLGLVPCVDGLEGLPADDQAARDVVRQVLAEHPGPLAIRLPWDGAPPLAPGYVSIDLPVLSITDRVTVWRTILEEHGLLVREPDELAARYSVGPGVVARVCAQVAAGMSADERATIDVTAPLEAAVRQHLASKLSATATRVTRLSTWTQVVLPPDIQESVFELIARIKHRRTVYDTWGFDRVLTTARGVTALFSGGPGTGKTLVASAIANELGMDLYRVDLSRIMSKWIGETEQNLAKLFDAAEDGHAIILFDEADSLFAKRTEVRTSVDRYANLEVNYLLQRLDSFEGIAILTTNFGTSIDSAFKRRLSLRLTFPFPDEDAREALWRSHLPAAVPTAGSFDLGELARRYRLSGGYIRNATLRAAFLAAEERSPLTQDHLERAIKAEFREIGKIAESGILE
ncbi:MAG: ATP-binding protein [Kofleriaceae bacterium]